MAKNDEWKNKLDDFTYKVCRLGATEPAFSGKLLHNKEKGTYHCVCCDALLFESNAKFDSGSGWPSFDKATSSNAILYLKDESHRMQRIEIRCGNCDSHLGHVFNDGPTVTGQRYCVNSVSLRFQAKKVTN